MLFATAGSGIAIGPAKAAQSAPFVEGDFNSLSYVDIGWVESLGAFGDTAAEVTFDAIGEARTQKFKGTRNAGNVALVCGIDSADDGQAALLAAQETDYDYAFRVTFDDAPSGGTPSVRYFIAKVMAAPEQLDGANNVAKLNSTLAINSNVVRVDATG